MKGTTYSIDLEAEVRRDEAVLQILIGCNLGQREILFFFLKVRFKFKTDGYSRRAGTLKEERKGRGRTFLCVVAFDSTLRIMSHPDFETLGVTTGTAQAFFFFLPRPPKQKFACEFRGGCVRSRHGARSGLFLYCTSRSIARTPRGRGQ